MTTYPTNRIISAFENAINPHKVEEYTEIMKTLEFNHEFPPIWGFESIITEDDVNQVWFMDGKLVLKEHLGIVIWKVTDGHHRTLSAINAQLGWIEVEPDPNCFVTEEELINYRKNY